VEDGEGVMPKREDAITNILLKKGLVSQAQIDRAKEEAKKTNLSLEKALEKMGFLTEEDLVNILAESMGVLYIKLEDYLIDPEVTNLIPEDLARKHKVIPLFKIGDTLTVAMSNPRDIIAIDEIRMKGRVGLVEPVYSTEKEIQKAIEQYYGVTGSVEDIMSNMPAGKLPPVGVEELDSKLLAKEADQAPVVKLVNMIITQAVKEKASDIHVEPEEDKMRVRYRIDGILREVSTPPKHLQSVIISRIKILSKLDIAESRKPQDGRMLLRMENKKIDLRVSSFPTVHGENIVMRILDKTSLVLGLKELGFGDRDYGEFDKLIHLPYGIVLVTGPTGSGKTTTLYSALSTINSMELNIITVEDPVEYEIPLIRQTQINPKAGLTFASGMRAILRQDPDVIMIGEVRDKETAEIAVQASLTGHLVFSTLHTNDAPSALPRLLDMDVEPFLISTSVVGILAQRLVRVICKECKEKYTPQAELLRDLNVKEKIDFYKGKGCNACKGSGYAGRIGIYELLLMSEEIRKMVIGRASTDEIRAEAKKEGMRTLREDGLDKIQKGITTVEEVLRVTEAV
jgi:type IV pilus assembly protein PilB